MPAQRYDVLIIGGGILGTAISYFLSALNGSRGIAVAEQARSVAFHTSGRNTGKVHAPYLYDPDKKRLSARAAFHGYTMWEEYSRLRGLAFKKDGVIQVALNQKDTKVLERYLRWGMQNGLEEKDIKLMDRGQTRRIEPEIECEAALHISRDGSVNYAELTRSLMTDSRRQGTSFLPDARVTKIRRDDNYWRITINGERDVLAGLLINAAGGQAIDIAHEVGVAENYTDVHFRGEYWKAPKEYSNLTKTSIYSVPEFPEYPFLDPHWIVRVNGSCEIGPNAVPVFSPYGYGTAENLSKFVPKMLEMLGSGARKAILDGRFRRLAANEIRSMSRSAMIERVRRFLPGINPEKITERGTSGIRSSVIDGDGGFVPDVILASDDSSLHILNYNSPGATGALPFAAHITSHLSETGLFKSMREDGRCGPWRFSDILERIRE